ncbi:MAG: NAD(P)-binding domain-containing protein [Actinomycetota bacterium]
MPEGEGRIVADVVIVGGGPAGVLLAHRFREHGIRHKVLERGKIGQSWRDMRPGMVLLSPGVPGTDWTSLTLERPIWSYPGVRRPFPTREDFLCYVDAFARDQRVEVTERTEAVGARRTPEGFAVAVSGGDEIRCRFLVIATGSASAPHYPEIPGVAGNPRVLHSGDFLNCMAYVRKRVLVIGGGNSAAELCIELAGTAHTTMSTHGPLRFFSESGELDHIRGSSESVLKELFRFGILSLREEDPVVSLSGGEVTFTSGARESFDSIVFATGYRPRWIPVEGGTVDVGKNGYPRISPVGESSVRGLYFCGSLALFHPRCAFIHGFRNYVEKVFWDIADRL